MYKYKFDCICVYAEVLKSILWFELILCCELV